MGNLPPRMLKINEVSEEYSLPKHFIRQLCLQGKIVYVKAGTKYLINANAFVDYLNIGEAKGGDENVKTESKKIHN